MVMNPVVPVIQEWARGLKYSSAILLFMFAFLSTVYGACVQPTLIKGLSYKCYLRKILFLYNLIESYDQTPPETV